ncbi:MAG: murein L,D-transpeptidase catalytic domain family protein [Taibaiella sp.]|nr:murein L,D-transpeptidase catalytic domain family protein [Taibaiella sp.]
MKRAILCIAVYLISATIFKSVRAGESIVSLSPANEVYVTHLYHQIDFGKNPLSYDVFEKAYRGYRNLKEAGKLNDQKNLLTVCDFTLSSSQNRMWIIDLANKKVLFNTYVAHGQGSGEEFATAFSNRNDSHQSSIGFYVTGDTYIGEHGASLRLMGMDNGYNNAAYDRGIVVHGADYVSGQFVTNNQRLGRSWGCPAVPSQLSAPIINTIKSGTCLFLYYPEKKYLQTAYWLNKKIDHMPADQFTNDLQTPLMAFAKRDTVIQYLSPTGKVDSMSHTGRM